MTREEIIDGLKAVRTIHNGNYAPQIDEAIKLLEQEPILDKIRDEIEQKCCITVGKEHEPAITLYDIFQIIDKYKIESEPQDNDIEKRKLCINYEDGCEEWAGCPCVYYKVESEDEE